MSTLIPQDNNPVEHINHISSIATQRATDFYRSALDLFQIYLNQADYLVAHYAAFDSQWLGQCHIPASAKPWLCTAIDFSWPKVKRQKVTLSQLAIRYGVPQVNRHRALADCQIIAAIFDKIHPLEPLIYQAIQHRNHRNKDSCSPSPFLGEGAGG